MDDDIRVTLDEMPEKAPRSKLEPHEDFIRQLRRKGRTYEEIAQFFAEKLNLKVAPVTRRTDGGVRGQTAPGLERQ